jgi:predicted ArsR family transcriptional regulator
MGAEDEAAMAPRPADEAVTVDARNLRGIAHPIRVRLLTLLRDDGPSTATRLAARLGLNSGATSYHLRQLERFGFVVDDERAAGRERWWRAAHRGSTSRDLASLQGEEGAMAETYLRALAALHADATNRAIDEWRSQPTAWLGAGTLSDFALKLTATEFRHLLKDLLDVLESYRRFDAAGAPRTARTVTVQIQAFPKPADDDGSDER